VPNQPLFVLFQRGPNPQAGGGGQWALTGVLVKRDEPRAVHGYRRGNQYQVVAAWTERRRKATGQAFGLLKGFGPVNWLQAEAYSLVQVSEELVGSVLLSQKDVEDLDARQVRETDNLGTLR
jgi:hypothetical protein